MELPVARQAVEFAWAAALGLAARPAAAIHA